MTIAVPMSAWSRYKIPSDYSWLAKVAKHTCLDDQVEIHYEPWLPHDLFLSNSLNESSLAPGVLTYACYSVLVLIRHDIHNNPAREGDQQTFSTSESSIEDLSHKIRNLEYLIQNKTKQNKQVGA